MTALPSLSNVEQLPGFRWTAPVAQHADFHCFVDAPVHLDADDFDPWSEELPEFNPDTFYPGEQHGNRR